ncbi:MAG: hypothetical protein KJ622_12970 [Alphaproteobacteria bacterium]|nr:hypothetical protein [Alphaproteobacteria bacterium]
MQRFAVLGRYLTIAALFAAVGGCSSNIKLEDLQSGATGALKAIPQAAQAIVPKAVKPPVGSATEVYTRVARGALTCWMGGQGGMRATHLFQADAKPRSEGGAAQIDIHERLKDKPNVPGKRVFAVTIAPLGEGASVTVDNLGLPQQEGEAMSLDVERWAAAEEGCPKEPITEGWAIPAAVTEPAQARKPKP